MGPPSQAVGIFGRFDGANFTMDPLDLDRLQRVRRWAAVPVAERGAEWVREFEAAFWPAPLFLPEEPECTTPTGHPFLRLSARTPPTGANRPAMLVDRLIRDGRGLMLTDEEDVPVVWMSIAQVLSYRLYGRAFEKPLPIADERRGFTIQAGETLMLAPVGEATLPNAVRVNLRRYFQRTLGIQTPRAVWVGLPNGQSGIAFDLEPERVADEIQVAEVFRSISWLLPARIRYYRIDALAQASEMRPF